MTPSEFKRGQPVRARVTVAEKKMPGWYVGRVDAETHAVAFRGSTIRDIKDENIEAVPEDMQIAGRFAVFIKPGGECSLVSCGADDKPLAALNAFGWTFAALIDMTPYGIRFAEGHGLMPGKYDRIPPQAG